MGRRIVIGLLIGIVALFGITKLFNPKPYAQPTTKVASATDPGEEWRDFRPRSGLFSISLPTIPQHASETATMPATNEKIVYDIYLAQMRSGTTFLINVIQYPPTVDTTHPDVLMENAIKDMQTSNPAKKLLGTQNGTFQECPYTDFTIGSPDAGIAGRVLLYNRSLYIVSVADRDTDVAKATFRKVIDTFRLPSK